MRLDKFFLYTFIGGTIWNAILLYAGIILGKNWTNISKYTTLLDVFFIVLVIAGIIYFIYHFRKR